MNVYLVQHAEAKTKEEDPQRPLSEKGLADIRKVAAFVAKQADMNLSCIMHSGKTRAQQTSDVLAEYLNPSGGVREAEGLAPLDSPSLWAGRLAEEAEDIMLVGHLPYMGKLAAHLVSRDEEKKTVDFQMAGIVCLGRDDAGNWSVKWMVVPQIL